MKILNSNIETPLYQQIYDILCKQISDGKFQTGDKIPSEDQLCKMFDVSRVTVRNALGRMVDENILTKKHGKGTFVASPVFVESVSAQGSFTKSCIQMGAQPSTKLISRKMQKAGKNIAKHLDVNLGQQIICIKRLRLINNTAAIFEVDYFTEDYSFMIQADVEHIPMLELLQTNNDMVSRRKYVDTFEVRFATKEQAILLECPVNTPLLGISQIVFNDQRNILYYNEQFIRSDIYKYVAGN